MAQIQVIMASAIFVLISLTFALASEGSEEELKEALDMKRDSFNEEVSKGPHFVMFFAPWCTHCKRMHPVWQDLASKYHEEATKEITIGKVDCTVETELCSDNDVTGYPTLKFFKSGQDSGTKYRGKRDLETLTNFINEQLGKVPAKAKEAVSDPEEPVVEDGLHILSGGSFRQHVSNGDHFVKFFAPWCGHCKKMAPAWKDLAKQVHEDSTMKVKVGEVDCTKFQEVCKDNQVSGYPTLMYFRDGKKLETYDGSRVLKDLMEYVKYWNGEKEDDKEADVKEDQEKVAASPSSSALPLELDASNFEESIKSGFTFVKFFAPWCGHCKKLAPNWEKLAKAFEGQAGKVTIAKVDCTAGGDKNRELCTNHKVKGFPTLVMFKDGERTVEYKGDRSLDDLKSFVKAQIELTEGDLPSSAPKDSSKDEL